MPQPTRNKSQAPAAPVAAPVNGNGKSAAAGAGEKGEPKILFQKYFKSVGPRTYAAQIKEASNGNHVLVITEGKRDGESDEIKKTKVFVFSEDFGTFFRMLHETAQWIRTNPVPEDVKRRRARFWAKHNASSTSERRESAATAAKTIAPPPPPARTRVAVAASPAKPAPAAKAPATKKPAPPRRGR